MATDYGSFSWPSTASSANASVGINGTTAPTSSTEVGGIDPGGNLHPFQTDNSGHLLVDLSSASGAPFHVIVDSSALPAGASTSALQTTGNASLTSIDGKTPALGQALATASVPVVLTAAQLTTLTPPTAVTANQGAAGATAWLVDASAHTQPVSGTVAVSNFPATQPVSGTVAATQSGTWNITNISGTISLPTGAATSANQATEITSLASIVTNTANIPAKGQATMANSAPVAIASDQSTIPVNQVSSTTSAVTSVNSSASSVSLLASNASRKQAAFYNDSTAVLYLKLGATASTTSYTVQLSAGAYYELPGKGYTGAIDGIWASANGAVRITELT